ncbi:MAG: molecular chaperone DnaJ [Polyangiaceae bacterium]|nr:molecular chaperone DnaJ [Polyangiaceae bacterium]
MSQKRDYYEVLGVQQGASADEIRKAYRQNALKFHPDRNPGDAEAEAKFKEATEAYSVLSDDQKRAQYDRFGHAAEMGGGFDGGMGDVLSQFQDMFSDFFGGFGGNGGSRRRQPERGRDVGVEVELTLAEAMTGCKKEITVVGAAPCETCAGSGAKPGTKPQPCVQCGGAGQVATQRGFIMFQTTCPRCRGGGVVISDKCESCAGRGSVERRSKVLVSFPAGIDAGQRLRVPAQGMPGVAGTAPGDLYVDVSLTPHDTFQREGADLATRREVSFAQAALGTSIPVVLPDGSELEVDIKAGTQPGTVLHLRGQGVRFVDGGGRGDLHVVVGVRVPTSLSRKAKKLLAEFEAELDAK